MKPKARGGRCPGCGGIHAPPWCKRKRECRHYDALKRIILLGDLETTPIEWCTDCGCIRIGGKGKWRAPRDKR